MINWKNCGSSCTLASEVIRSQLKRQEVDLVFHFGNHQTLQSKLAIHFPLRGQWFRVAVVPGETPFLLAVISCKQFKPRLMQVNAHCGASSCRDTSPCIKMKRTWGWWKLMIYGGFLKRAPFAKCRLSQSRLVNRLDWVASSPRMTERRQQEFRRRQPCPSLGPTSSPVKSQVIGARSNRG